VFASDRKAAFLSRAALLTDYKNGFLLSEFIAQIVDVTAGELSSYQQDSNPADGCPAV
jgi:hypothetical protein